MPTTNEQIMALRQRGFAWCTLNLLQEAKSEIWGASIIFLSSSNGSRVDPFKKNLFTSLKCDNLETLHINFAILDWRSKSIILKLVSDIINCPTYNPFIWFLLFLKSNYFFQSRYSIAQLLTNLFIYPFSI